VCSRERDFFSHITRPEKPEKETAKQHHRCSDLVRLGGVREEETATSKRRF
jgi:hypothetical protein